MIHTSQFMFNVETLEVEVRKSVGHRPPLEMDASGSVHSLVSFFFAIPCNSDFVLKFEYF